MLDKDYIETLVKKIGDSIVDRKSYSHKPHLAGLPYDRRSTSWDELSERYGACISEQDKRKEEMNKLREVLRQDLSDFKESRKDLNDSLDKLEQWNKDNQEFFEADDKLQNEKIEKAKELEKQFENVFDNMEDVLEGLSKRESDVYQELDRISGLFLVNGSSILPKGDVDTVLKLADDYVDILDNSMISFDKEQYDLADSLRDLTKNSDSIIQLQNNAHTIGEMSGLQDHINIMQHETSVRNDSIKSTKKELDKLYNEWQDFADERGRIAIRCDELGLL